jgi:hypothetical protein
MLTSPLNFGKIGLGQKEKPPASGAPEEEVIQNNNCRNTPFNLGNGFNSSPSKEIRLIHRY